MPQTRVHLLDTPGFPDFIGQSIGALDAVETAAIVVNAASGIEMITSRMMDWAGRRKLCRLIIINKIDAENVDLPQVLSDLRAAFGKEVLPINLPAGGGTRVVDCFFTPDGEADFLLGDRSTPGADRPGDRGRRGTHGQVPRTGRGDRGRTAARAVRTGAA